MSAYNGLGSQK